MRSLKPRSSSSDERGRRSFSRVKPRISLRGTRGSVLPVVVFSLTLTIAFLAFAVDVMRTAHTISVVDFGSQSTALAAYSAGANADGSYAPDAAKSNMLAAVRTAGGAGGSAWNMAPAGPEGPKTRTDITYADSDVSFVNNPNPADASEVFIQVKARRDGNDGLKMFFLPAIFAFNSWSGLPVPPNVNAANPYRTTEVVGQPASRVGAGAPVGSSNPRAAQIAGFASFPLAVSNNQFSIAAQPSQTLLTYVVDFVASNQPAYTSAPAAGHLKGCLVNVSPTGSNLTYYGSGQGNLAIDQLNGTLQYFNGSFAQGLAPGVVERGSKLNGFDPADQTFQQRKTQVVGYLSSLVGKNCILPVVQKSGDQFFNGPNTVVGFARMRLLSVTSNNSGITASFQMLESVALPNVSFANGVASVPAVSGAQLPPPVFPFTTRVLQGDGLSQRPRGVVLAPALSARNVNPIVVN